MTLCMAKVPHQLRVAQEPTHTQVKYNTRLSDVFHHFSPDTHLSLNLTVLLKIFLNFLLSLTEHQALEVQIKKCKDCQAQEVNNNCTTDRAHLVPKCHSQYPPKEAPCVPSLGQEDPSAAPLGSPTR